MVSAREFFNPIDSTESKSTIPEQTEQMEKVRELVNELPDEIKEKILEQIGQSVLDDPEIKDKIKTATCEVSSIDMMFTLELMKFFQIVTADLMSGKSPNVSKIKESIRSISLLGPVAMVTPLHNLYMSDTLNI